MGQVTGMRWGRGQKLPRRKRKKIFQLFTCQFHSGVDTGQSQQLVTQASGEYLKMKLLFFCTNSEFSRIWDTPFSGLFPPAYMWIISPSIPSPYLHFKAREENICLHLRTDFPVMHVCSNLISEYWNINEDNKWSEIKLWNILELLDSSRDQVLHLLDAHHTRIMPYTQ